MQTVECAEVKVAKDSVVFEVGDLVCLGNAREPISRIFVNDKQQVKLEVNNNVVEPYAVRFVSDSVDYRYKNILLEALDFENSAREAKAYSRKFKALQRAAAKHREKLNKSGLCDKAIEAQIREEYKELFE